MQTTQEHSLICGWSEVIHYIRKHPLARITVEAHGNGAVRVTFPTRDMLEEFIK